MKVKSLQTNCIYGRFHKTVPQMFYQVAFRKKIYNSLDELQTDLDAWLEKYNNVRTHQGKMCYNKMPMRTFLDNLDETKEKLIAA